MASHSITGINCHFGASSQHAVRPTVVIDIIVDVAVRSPSPASPNIPQEYGLRAITIGAIHFKISLHPHAAGVSPIPCDSVPAPESIAVKVSRLGIPFDNYTPLVRCHPWSHGNICHAARSDITIHLDPFCGSDHAALLVHKCFEPWRNIGQVEVARVCIGTPAHSLDAHPRAIQRPASACALQAATNAVGNQPAS